MIKKGLLFLSVSIILFLLNWLVLETLLEKMDFSPRFDVFSVCLFHLLASLIVFILEELAIETMPSQAGGAYLALVFVKMGVFIMIFNSSILSNEGLYKSEKIALIIPFVSFLLVEALFVAKSLKLLDISLNVNNASSEVK